MDVTHFDFRTLAAMHPARFACGQVSSRLMTVA